MLLRSLLIAVIGLQLLNAELTRRVVHQNGVKEFTIVREIKRNTCSCSCTCVPFGVTTKLPVAVMTTSLPSMTPGKNFPTTTLTSIVESTIYEVTSAPSAIEIVPSDSASFNHEPKYEVEPSYIGNEIDDITEENVFEKTRQKLPLDTTSNTVKSSTTKTVISEKLTPINTVTEAPVAKTTTFSEALKMETLTTNNGIPAVDEKERLASAVTTTNSKTNEVYETNKITVDIALRKVLTSATATTASEATSTLLTPFEIGKTTKSDQTTAFNSSNSTVTFEGLMVTVSNASDQTTTLASTANDSFGQADTTTSTMSSLLQSTITLDDLTQSNTVVLLKSTNDQTNQEVFEKSLPSTTTFALTEELTTPFSNFVATGNVYASTSASVENHDSFFVTRKTATTSSILEENAEKVNMEVDLKNTNTRKTLSGKPLSTIEPGVSTTTLETVTLVSKTTSSEKGDKSATNQTKTETSEAVSSVERTKAPLTEVTEEPVITEYISKMGKASTTFKEPTTPPSAFVESSTSAEKSKATTITLETTTSTVAESTILAPMATTATEKLLTTPNETFVTEDDFEHLIATATLQPESETKKTVSSEMDFKVKDLLQRLKEQLKQLKAVKEKADKQNGSTPLSAEHLLNLDTEDKHKNDEKNVKMILKSTEAVGAVFEDGSTTEALTTESMNMSKSGLMAASENAIGAQKVDANLTTSQVKLSSNVSSINKTTIEANEATTIFVLTSLSASESATPVERTVHDLETSTTTFNTALSEDQSSSIEGEELTTIITDYAPTVTAKISAETDNEFATTSSFTTVTETTTLDGQLLITNIPLPKTDSKTSEVDSSVEAITPSFVVQEETVFAPTESPSKTSLTQNFFIDEATSDTFETTIENILPTTATEITVSTTPTPKLLNSADMSNIVTTDVHDALAETTNSVFSTNASKTYAMTTETATVSASVTETVSESTDSDVTTTTVIFNEDTSTIINEKKSTTNSGTTTESATDRSIIAEQNSTAETLTTIEKITSANGATTVTSASRYDGATMVEAAETKFVITSVTSPEFRTSTDEATSTSFAVEVEDTGSTMEPDKTAITQIKIPTSTSASIKKSESVSSSIIEIETILTSTRAAPDTEIQSTSTTKTGLTTLAAESSTIIEPFNTSTTIEQSTIAEIETSNPSTTTNTEAATVVSIATESISAIETVTKTSKVTVVTTEADIDASTTTTSTETLAERLTTVENLETATKFAPSAFVVGGASTTETIEVTKIPASPTTTTATETFKTAESTTTVSTISKAPATLTMELNTPDVTTLEWTTLEPETATKDSKPLTIETKVKTLSVAVTTEEPTPTSTLITPKTVPSSTIMATIAPFGETTTAIPTTTEAELDMFETTEVSKLTTKLVTNLFISNDVTASEKPIMTEFTTAAKTNATDALSTEANIKTATSTATASTTETATTIETSSAESDASTTITFEASAQEVALEKLKTTEAEIAAAKPELLTLPSRVTVSTTEIPTTTTAPVANFTTTEVSTAQISVTTVKPTAAEPTVKLSSGIETLEAVIERELTTSEVTIKEATINTPFATKMDTTTTKSKTEFIADTKSAETTLITESETTIAPATITMSIATTTQEALIATSTEAKTDAESIINSPMTEVMATTIVETSTEAGAEGEATIKTVATTESVIPTIKAPKKTAITATPTKTEPFFVTEETTTFTAKSSATTTRKEEIPEAETSDFTTTLSALLIPEAEETELTSGPLLQTDAKTMTNTASTKQITTTKSPMTTDVETIKNPTEEEIVAGEHIGDFVVASEEETTISATTQKNFKIFGDTDTTQLPVIIKLTQKPKLVPDQDTKEMQATTVHPPVIIRVTKLVQRFETTEEPETATTETMSETTETDAKTTEIEVDTTENVTQTVEAESVNSTNFTPSTTVVSNVVIRLTQPPVEPKQATEPVQTPEQFVETSQSTEAPSSSPPEAVEELKSVKPSVVDLLIDSTGDTEGLFMNPMFGKARPVGRPVTYQKHLNADTKAEPTQPNFEINFSTIPPVQTDPVAKTKLVISDELSKRFEQARQLREEQRRLELEVLKQKEFNLRSQLEKKHELEERLAKLAETQKWQHELLHQAQLRQRAFANANVKSREEVTHLESARTTEAVSEKLEPASTGTGVPSIESTTPNKLMETTQLEINEFTTIKFDNLETTTEFVMPEGMPEHCAPVQQFLKIFKVRDPEQWLRENCVFVKQYFPNASCSQIQTLLSECFVAPAVVVEPADALFSL